MKQNYVLFSNDENWGDVHFLDTVLSKAESIVLGSKIEKKELKRFLKQLDKNSPDLEEFGSFLASFAFDSCCAFDGLLNFMIDGDVENLLLTSVSAINTVDMFVQEKGDLEPNDSLLESKIANDDFMIAEENRQRMLISELKKHPTITEIVLNQLKQINRNGENLVDLDLINLS